MTCDRTTNSYCIFMQWAESGGSPVAFAEVKRYAAEADSL